MRKASRGHGRPAVQTPAGRRDVQQQLPDFLGIGAPRPGTRWLAQCLAEHPEVALPETEVYFFTSRRIVWPYWNKGLEWYGELLASARRPETRQVGEVTPVYLFDDDSPQKIHQVAPNVRLICCLRDQADRAFSFYRLFLHHSPQLTPQSYPFSKFLTYSTEVYGREGFYLEHLRRYFQHFDREQLLILLYDDLQSDPAGLVQRVYRHLGVDDQFVPQGVTRRINPMPLAPGRRRGRGPGRRRWNRALSAAAAPLRQLARLVSPDPLKEAEQSGILMTPAIRPQMHEMFREHNDELGAMLGRDLRHWNLSHSESKAP